MSSEGRDKSYRPKIRPQQLGADGIGRSRCPRTSRVNYREIEVLSGSGSEDTVITSESSIGSVKLESEGSVPLFESDRESSLWTPGTLTSRANQVSEQLKGK